MNRSNEEEQEGNKNELKSNVSILVQKRPLAPFRRSELITEPSIPRGVREVSFFLSEIYV
jgi:hypothetical protein